jgi:hypothetical protein
VAKGGTGEVSYPDNFTAVVTLSGVEAGGEVILRANYFSEWTAACAGKPVPLRNAEGQIAFAAPATDCTVTLEFPRNRRWLLVPFLAAAAAVLFARRAIL